MDWLYDAMRELVTSAINVYFEKDPVFKHFVTNSTNLEFGTWTNVNEVGSKNHLHSHKVDAWLDHLLCSVQREQED